MWVYRRIITRVQESNFFGFEGVKGSMSACIWYAVRYPVYLRGCVNLYIAFCISPPLVHWVRFGEWRWRVATKRTK
jgi:hypothetical protein